MAVILSRGRWVKWHPILTHSRRHQQTVGLSVQQRWPPMSCPTLHWRTLSPVGHCQILSGKQNQKDQFFSTHWGRVMHICISKLTITASDNGLSPGSRQAIIWTNAEIMIIGPLGIKFTEILIEIYIFSFKKIIIKQINYAHINIFQKKRYWFKIRMEFLQYIYILAKIELICRQLTMLQLCGIHPCSGEPERMAWGWPGGLAMS